MANIVVILVVVAVVTPGIGSMVTDPDAPKGAARVEDVRVEFHPKDCLGPVKMPPVDNGNPERTEAMVVT